MQTEIQNTYLQPNSDFEMQQKGHIIFCMTKNYCVGTLLSIYLRLATADAPEAPFG